MNRLGKEGAALVYRCAKQHSEPSADKRGAKVDELTLTPLELMGDGVQIEPDWATDWDLAAQPAPEFYVDQRFNW